MKKIFLLLFLFFNAIAFSQAKVDSTKGEDTYISLKHYNKVLTKKDSLNFKYLVNDTLVLVKNHKKTKSVLVKSKSRILAERYKTATNTIAFISLKYYRRKYKKPLTKTDSLNFIFKNNDTLVMVENYVSPKGVSVPYEPKDSTFLNYYKKVAFHHKNDSINKNTSMKYWKEGIKIFFAESVGNQTKNNFMSFAKTITTQIDSLNVSEVKKLEDSNYVVYYFGDFEYEPELKNYNSSQFYSWWKQNKIYKTSVKVDTKVYYNEDMVQNKLREFFVISLGYFKLNNDFECESFFSNCYSPNKKLTQFDMELLKYHYSYGICKGTSLEVFEDQHKRAKEIYKNTGRHMYFRHLN